MVNRYNDLTDSEGREYVHLTPIYEEEPRTEEPRTVTLTCSHDLETWELGSHTPAMLAEHIQDLIRAVDPGSLTTYNADASLGGINSPAAVTSSADPRGETLRVDVYIGEPNTYAPIPPIGTCVDCGYRWATVQKI